MTKRFGFTLAEVLITLGIIGVVAAMTIPNLIANTNGAKFRSQFKKTLSTLNQAGLMAQAQYDFDYAGTTITCTGTVETDGAHHPDKDMSFCAILNGTLTGQTYWGSVNNIQRNVNGGQVPYSIVKANGYTGTLDAISLADYYAYTLADGSIVAFKKTAQGCELPIGSQLKGDVLGRATTTVDVNGNVTAGLANCLGFIDVNGATLPNREVTCTNGNKATVNVETPCTVKNDANHMTDIFPVVFHDATVEPASDAAKYVLTTSK